MWSLLEESNGKSSVVHQIRKLGSWHMCKNEVIAKYATRFVCLKCRGIMEEKVDLIKNLCNEVEAVNGFCYLGDRLSASGGCEVAVTARIRIGWVRFRECGVIIWNRFPLKIKGRVYCCIRSAILNGREA